MKLRLKSYQILFDKGGYGNYRARIQRVYYYCLLNIPIKDTDFGPTNINDILGMEIEVSQALQNLLFEFERGKCPTLDFHIVEGSLLPVANEYINQQKDSWFIDYYLVGFWYVSGYELKAKNRLKNLSSRGNAKAEMMLNEL